MCSYPLIMLQKKGWFMPKEKADYAIKNAGLNRKRKIENGK